eukprot:8241013-Karenia_brevis.AAC.1
MATSCYINTTWRGLSRNGWRRVNWKKPLGFLERLRDCHIILSMKRATGPKRKSDMQGRLH